MGITMLQTGTWLAGITQLLDEHHLVVLTDHRRTRDSFAQGLGRYLGAFPETQVITIQGRFVRDLGAFARAVRDATGQGGSVSGGTMFDDVMRWLRAGSARVRRRFLIWRDADELLEADVALFSRLANGLFAVAAEHEFLSPEPLVLTRVVFTGGEKLGAYAEEEHGQFHTWLKGAPDRPEDDFERVFDCQSTPRVLTYRLDG